MPGFLHFYQGAVTVSEFYDMPHATYLQMRAYQKQAEQQLKDLPRGR
jgi:hypothetical protein